MSRNDRDHQLKHITTKLTHRTKNKNPLCLIKDSISRPITLSELGLTTRPFTPCHIFNIIAICAILPLLSFFIPTCAFLSYSLFHLVHMLGYISSYPFSSMLAHPLALALPFFSHLDTPHHDNVFTRVELVSQQLP